MTTPRSHQTDGRDRLWPLPTPVRRLLLIAPPSAFAGLTIVHPQPDENTQALVDGSTWFRAYHMIHLPLIGLVAISVLLLADQFGRASAWPLCLGMGTFMVFFSAYDTLAGIGTGLAMRGTRGLPESQQDIVFDIVRTWPAADPWAAGAPRAQWVLLGLAALFLMLGHPAPFGTLAFASLSFAAIIHERQASRALRTPLPDISQSALTE